MFQIMWYTSSKNFDLSNVRTLYDLLEQSTIPRSIPKVDYLLDSPILGNSKRVRAVSKPTPTCSLHPIDDRYVSTFYNERVDTYLEGVRGKKKFFEVGSIYKLRSSNSPRYELIKLVEKLDGVCVNSLIMKPIDNVETKIYSLSKTDCEYLNIPYQNGLQIFPPHLEIWEKVNNLDILHDPTKLGTYPIYEGNVINTVVIKISNVKYWHNDLVELPSVGLVTNNTINNIIITPSKDVKIEAPIFCKVITNVISENCDKDSIVDKNNCMFLLVDFHRSTYYGKKGNLCRGIDRDDVINSSFNELFTINVKKWD